MVCDAHKIDLNRDSRTTFNESRGPFVVRRAGFGVHYTRVTYRCIPITRLLHCRYKGEGLLSALYYPYKLHHYAFEGVSLSVFINRFHTLKDVQINFSMDNRRGGTLIRNSELGANRLK